MTFSTTTPVRFAHVDPAGIVFYPRYFEMLNGVVEDYFADIAGVDFATMHLERRLGVPTVKLEVEFTAPSRLGELLGWTLDFVRVGRSSADMVIEARCGGQLRMRAQVRLVCMHLDTGVSASWPTDMRPRETPCVA